MKSDLAESGSGSAPIEERMELVREILDLPENVKVFSLFAMGYPAEERPQPEQIRSGENTFYGTGGNKVKYVQSSVRNISCIITKKRIYLHYQYKGGL